MELLDLGNAPEIYADGIAAVYIVGEIARMHLFAWRLIDGKFQRVLNLIVTRPANTLGQASSLRLAAAIPKIIPGGGERTH